MNTTPRIVFSLIAATLLSPALVLRAADTPKVDSKAEKVLRQHAEFYRQMKSFSGASTTFMKMKMQGMKMETETQSELAMRRPNFFAMRTKGGGAFGAMAGMDLVCDGKNVYTHMGMLRRYTVQPAPKELDGMPGEMLMQGQDPGMSVMDAFLRKDPYAAIMEDVESVSYAGTEKVGDVECHKLRFVQPQADVDVWIATGKKPWMIQLKPDMTRALQEAKKAMEEAGQDAPPGFNPADMNMQITIKYSDWKQNPRLADDVFQFTPPNSSQKVESLFEGLGQPEEHELVGQPAPALELKLLDGGRLDLAAHKGKQVVILDFWATWCPPCVKGLPHLDKLARDYADKDVAVYAVNQRESPETIKRFLKRKNLSLTVALDDGKGGKAYKVEGIPQTVIIGKSGVIESIHVGFGPGMEKKLKQELDTLLSGKSLLKKEQ